MIVDIFETLTYGENQVRDYAYAFKSNSGYFREFKDGISLLKWYYSYQLLNDEDFSLKGASRMQFITDVFLSELQVSSVVESILQTDLSNSQKASLIDFYYLSSRRVENLKGFLSELGKFVEKHSEIRLVIVDDQKSIEVTSSLSLEDQSVMIGSIGKLVVKADK